MYNVFALSFACDAVPCLCALAQVVVVTYLAELMARAGRSHTVEPLSELCERTGASAPLSSVLTAPPPRRSGGVGFSGVGGGVSRSGLGEAARPMSPLSPGAQSVLSVVSRDGPSVMGTDPARVAELEDEVT